MKTVAGVLVGCLMLAACGSSSESACKEAGRLLCQKACACGKDRCVVATQAAAGTATISFDTEAQCTAMYVDLGCSGGGDPSIDYPACRDALERSVECLQSNPGALMLPTACSASQ